MEEVLMIVCNCPDAPIAETLAVRLVESGAAACVNIMPACTSWYRWQGKTERATEVPILIKSTRARYADVEALIRTAHPYEVPEIVAFGATTGLPAYLDWVRSATAA